MPLVLAGPISDHTYFSERIEPQLGDSVRYLGHLVADDLVAAVGMSAVALVAPQWDEPYGLVVAEALVCGTPVVAYSRGGIPESSRRIAVGWSQPTTWLRCPSRSVRRNSWLGRTLGREL